MPDGRIRVFDLVVENLLSGPASATPEAEGAVPRAAGDVTSYVEPGPAAAVRGQGQIDPTATAAAARHAAAAAAGHAAAAAPGYAAAAARHAATATRHAATPAPGHAAAATDGDAAASST